MNKKVALMVYPYFSMQEIANLCGLFRWNYGSETVVFSSTLEPVNSEEGLLIQPSKTFDDFELEEYDCLILPGCSDMRQPLNDSKIKDFLGKFQDNHDFVIGAICAGPAFLSQAGLLKNKKFTNSLFVEMNEMLEFIDEENIRYEPLVEDDNIITAVGFAFNEFAIAVARKIGYECPDKIYSGIPEKWDEKYYKAHLHQEGLEEFKKAFSHFIKQDN